MTLDVDATAPARNSHGPDSEPLRAAARIRIPSPPPARTRTPTPSLPLHTPTPPLVKRQRRDSHPQMLF